MPSISRIVTSASAATGLLIGTAATASAADTLTPQHADPLAVPAQTIAPLVTKADDALSLRDSKDLASLVHLGSLENSKDLASMAHLGSLEGSLAGSDLSKITSLEGSNWSHAGSSAADGNQVNTTIPIVVPVKVPVDTVTNLPVQGINKGDN